jgi:stage II sporulation protein D
VSLEFVTGTGTFVVPAVQFRKMVGYGVIRSTDFEVTLLDDDFVFIGVGHGHGVGLCQWGAKQRAENGFRYREILSSYYPGTRLEQYYTD